MVSMLDNCGMDCLNYSTTLNGWANNPATPSIRAFGTAGRYYGTSATSARTTLTNAKGWAIYGDAASGMACLPCPEFSGAPPEVSITNSVCSMGCVLAGGVIAAPAGSPCPIGSSIQYSTGENANNGAVWSSALPIYDQNGPAQTIKTRCSCEWDNTLNSPISAGVTTVPGICAPPSFTACPTGPITVNAATGQCVALVSYSVAATGVPTPALTYTFAGQTTGGGSGTGSGSSFNKGNTTVTVTATNVCSPAATCSFTVTVVDNQPPSIACPNNIARNTDASQCSALTQYTVTSSDNCPGATTTITAGLPSGSAFSKGTTTVEWKVTDGAGLTAACQFTVTVVDNQPPSIVCPANIVRGTDANLCSAVVTYATPTFSDNCTGASIAHLSGLTSGSTFPKGTSMVQWKATDAAGLTAICQFTITVNDTQLPSITCPSNIVKSTEAGQCHAATTYSAPTFSDNCPGVAATLHSGLPSGSDFPKGITTVVWRATDAAGLVKTCSFRVTVNDTENPLIACPSSQSANTGVGTCTALVTYPTPTATDNCGSLTVVRISGPASGSSFPSGTTNVTWRAIDGSGRSSTCSFSVAVTDAAPPTISCPSNISATGSSSPCAAPVGYTTPTATDNCGVQSVFLLIGQPSSSSFPAGTTNVVWRAVDVNGNSATCAFSVTVNCGASPDPSEGGESVTAERDVASPPLRGGRVGLLLSPNPATTEVQISIENLGETGGELTVMDAQGRLMWQSNVQHPMSHVALDNFAAGVYFVTLRAEGKTATKRLLVAK